MEDKISEQSSPGQGDTLNKGGRPFVKEGEKLTPTSIKLTNEDKIRLRRLGGVKWIREMIKLHTKEENGN